jgi:hypothetical protein
MAYRPAFLFQQNHFLQKNTASSYVSYACSVKGKVIGGLTFHAVGEKAISLTSSPFGSYWHAPIQGVNLLLPFLEWVKKDLKKRGFRSIVLRLAPDGYANTMNGIFIRLLRKAGFKVVRIDQNQQIMIDSNSFRAKIAPAERSKLNKAKKRTFSIQVEDALSKEAYGCIVKNRSYRGYPLTMSYHDLSRNVETFKAFEVLVLRFDHHIVATIVSIRVTASIFYHFYMADDPEYRQYSPLVLLNEYAYDRAKEAGAKMIDLGISTNKGILNKGLYDFKKHLGATTCFKKTLAISL